MVDQPTDRTQNTEQPPPPPPPGAPGEPPQAPPTGASEERTWAMVTHLAAFVTFVGIPFGNILGPLVIWLIKKDRMPLVDLNGKRSLNFQITMTIAGLVCIPLMFLLIGFPLLIALIIADVVLTIIAAVKTSNGEDYEYPFSIKFLK